MKKELHDFLTAAVYPFNFKESRKPGFGFLAQGFTYIILQHAIQLAYSTGQFRHMSVVEFYLMAAFSILLGIAEIALVAQRLRDAGTKHPIAWSIPVFFIPDRWFWADVIIFIILNMWRKDPHYVDREE